MSLFKYFAKCAFHNKRDEVIYKTECFCFAVWEIK